MVLKKFFLLPLFLASSLFMQTGYADELDVRSVGNVPEGVSSPAHGLSMDAVLQRYGEPQNRIPAVGQPPITRWVYPDFTVYYEHNLVIHSVIHR
jgi:hypothetical protein